MMSSLGLDQSVLDQLDSSLDPSAMGTTMMDLDAEDIASFLADDQQQQQQQQQGDFANNNSNGASNGNGNANGNGQDAHDFNLNLSTASEDGQVTAGSPTKDGGLNQQQCVCPECGKIFNSVWYLKQHAVKHSNDRPFRCKFCGKTYKFRSNLYQHKCPERLRLQGPRVPRRRKLSKAQAAAAAAQATANSNANNGAGNGQPQQQQPQSEFTNGSLKPTAQRDSPSSSSGTASTSPGAQSIMSVAAQPAHVLTMPAFVNTAAQPQMLSPVPPPPQQHNYLPHAASPLCSPKEPQYHQMLSMQPQQQYYAPFMPAAAGQYSPLKPQPHLMRTVTDEYAQQYIEQHKNELHVCRRCKPVAYFPSREYLCRHMSWHSEQEGRRHACNQCAETFHTDTEFSAHLKHHVNSSAYRCTACTGSFKSQIWLRRHYTASARCQQQQQILSANGVPSDPYAFIQAPPPAAIKTSCNEEEDDDETDTTSTVSPQHSTGLRLRSVVSNALAALDSGVGSTSGGDVDSSPGTGGSLADSVELGYSHAANGPPSHSQTSDYAVDTPNSGMMTAWSMALAMQQQQPSTSALPMHMPMPGRAPSIESHLQPLVNRVSNRLSRAKYRLGLSRSASPSPSDTADESAAAGHGPHSVAVAGLRPVAYHTQAERALAHLDRLAATTRGSSRTQTLLTAQGVLDAFACKSMTSLRVTDAPPTPPPDEQQQPPALIMHSPPGAPDETGSMRTPPSSPESVAPESGHQHE